MFFVSPPKTHTHTHPVAPILPLRRQPSLPARRATLPMQHRDPLQNLLALHPAVNSELLLKIHVIQLRQRRPVHLQANARKPSLDRPALLVRLLK